MMTLRERLDAYEGQPEQDWSIRTKISVSERGQRYNAVFSRGHLSAAYAVDGGIIRDYHVAKCDKLILVDVGEPHFMELFVELKGRDIRHAIEQIEATVCNDLFADNTVTIRQARIVGRNIPRNTGNSITEKAKKRFLERYKCRLEIKSGPAVDKFPI